MTGYDEEQIGELLRLLPAPPRALERAAQELPQARAEAEQIIALAEQDAGFRARLIADLEATLQAEGFGTRPSVLATVRTRLKTEG